MIFLKNGEPATEISWIPPTTRQDGSPYDGSQHGGYNIYVDNQPFLTVPNDFNITSFLLADIGVQEEGTLSIQLSTVDSLGRESALSEAIIVEARVAGPKPPQDLRVS